MSSNPVWLITGSSGGLGLALTRYALSQGHIVIATSRNPSRTPELVAEVEGQGGKWLTLDALWEETVIKDTIQQAESIFGRLDIVVNNAAYCVLGSTEDVPDAEVITQMQVNFLAPLRVMRAVLSGMRKRKSGVILNVSSAQGLCPSPANGIYAASKAAMEAASDALGAEVAPFGIRVLIALPGAFRTNFANAGALTEPSEPYANDHPVGNRLKWIRELGSGSARGDPVKAAKVMFEAATGVGNFGSLIAKEKFLRVFIGPDCWQVADTKVNELRRTIDAEKDLAGSTDL
jgi:NAD(P)-dependent dehydrogenase (short-subunit alcohol dehydrogenase family)